jgi:hypothetical protein
LKDLYVYTLYEGGQLTKTIEKDVKVTREDKIVRKINADYRLSHGDYYLKCNLGNIEIMKAGYSNPQVIKVRYISFDINEITNEIRYKMSIPFLERYNTEQEQLREKINEFEVLKGQFYNVNR